MAELQETSLAERLRLAQISRRELLIGGGRFALGASGALALAACVSGTTNSPSSSGGIARFALSDGSPQDTIDPPRMGKTLFSNITAISIYDNIMVGDEQTLQPTKNGIVNDWNITSDLKTWTLKVRKGVEFHDGSKLTAADVAYSIQTQVQPNGPSPNSASAGKFLTPDNVKALDDSTVQLVLNQPNAFFYVYLQNRYMRVIKQGTTAPNDKHIGTGPFVFKEFTPGQSFHATRNKNYWQQGKPYLDEIQFLQVPEPASQFQSLTAKQVDLIQALTLPLAKTLQSSSDHAVLQNANSAWTFLVMDPRVDSRFKNQDLVRAVKLAVDRQELINTVYSGFATPGYDTPIPSSDGFFNSKLTLPTRDLSAVNEHLKAAGYSNGVDLGALYTGDITGAMVNFAQALQQQLASANIKCTIQQADAATYYDNIWMKKSLYVTYNLRRTPAEVFKIFYGKDAPYNETGFKPPEFDAALSDASSTSDFAKQKTAFDTAQQLVYDQDTRVLPLFAADVYGVDKRLQDVRLGPLNIVSFADAKWTK